MKLPIPILVFLLMLSACSSSEHVVSGRKFQKRKYQKGVYITKKAKKERPILVFNKENKTECQPSDQYSESTKQRNAIIRPPIKILDKNKDLNSVENAKCRLDEKLPFLEPNYVNDLSGFCLPTEDPEINIPAYVSLGGAGLFLADSLFLFTGIIGLIGFLLVLVFGIAALTPQFREKEGTIIAKVLLILIYISVGIIFTLLAFFSSVQTGGAGIPVAAMIVAVLFLVGLFLMV